jgi:cytochrome c553
MTAFAVPPIPAARGATTVRATAARAIAACAVCAAAAVLACGQPALAEGKLPAADPGKGQQIVGGVCSACHGGDGNSTLNQYPKIAGQPAEYIVKQLTDLTKPANDKSARVNGVMGAFATMLSADDRRNVAAYLSAQKPKAGVARVKETLDLGQRIFRAGIAERGVPACAGCHGPTGAGIPIQYPHLSGQWAEYTTSQLVAFRDGTRRNQLAMAQIAARLSDSEMKAVADYIAGLH